MAKSCCGGREPRVQRPVNVNLDQFEGMAATGDYPKVRIRYEGPIAAHMVTGLATKQKYGRKRRGDIFWVMREDAQANPEYFVVVGDAEGAALGSDLPKTALEVRPPTTATPAPAELPMVLRQPVDLDDTGRMNRAELMRDMEKSISQPGNQEALEFVKDISDPGFPFTKAFDDKPSESVVEMREQEAQKRRELEAQILKDHPELNVATTATCPKCGQPAEEIQGRRKYCYSCSPPR